jgi:hypothetical protein
MTISRFEGVSSAFTLGIGPSSKQAANPSQRKGKGNEFTVKVFELAWTVSTFFKKSQPAVVWGTGRLFCDR